MANSHFCTVVEPTRQHVGEQGREHGGQIIFLCTQDANAVTISGVVYRGCGKCHTPSSLWKNGKFGQNLVE